MLDAPAYLLSVATLLLAIGSLQLGARQVRRRLLAGWSGMPAQLADAVITVALLIWIAELLGTVGLLRRALLVAACLLVGFGLRLAVRPPASGAGQPPPAPPVGRWGRLAALTISAVLAGHWSIATVGVLHAGMTGYDSAWYHMPFAAHFAQTGSTLDFALVSPRYLSWFYPQNSELLHGVGIVLVQRDVLSPLLNLLWLVGCLGAAWCVGRPFGAGPWTLAAVAVLLDAGVMADQAGEARNDVLGLFFLLAAIALIVNWAAARRRSAGRGALATAGLAAGLAAGTKLSFLAPVGVLLVGIPALAAAGRRRGAALAFGAPVLAGCGFWYLRNTVLADNPLPWLRAVGPLQLGGPEQGLGGRPQASVMDYIGDGRVWHRWFEPGLSDRLGELWPLLLIAALIAIVACLARAPGPLKLVAAAAAAAAITYLFDGTSAEGPSGAPVGFASSLRHLLPALCLAMLLVPLAPGARSPRVRFALATLLATLLIAADLSADPWRPEYLLLAIAAVAFAAPAVLPGTAPKPRALPRVAPLVASVVVLLLTALGGWFVQRSYLEDRYLGQDFRSRGLNAAFAWASRHQDQRIATTLPLQYPLLGPDLSNQVSFVGRHHDDAGFTAIDRCRPWRAALAAGDYRFVVTAGRARHRRDGAGCLADDPRARQVMRRERVVVFRLQRPLITRFRSIASIAPRRLRRPPNPSRGRNRGDDDVRQQRPRS